MDGSSATPIRVICGPTAAGKSHVALWLAERFDLTVISADSRQIYRGFDIGTAKPSVQEQRNVRHLGIDVLDPMERASAAWWAAEANEWVDRANREGRIPVVVGGTGLYLRALFGSLFEEPPLDATKRRAIQEWAEGVDLDHLRKYVTALDPGRAHLGRTQLIRAIEISLLTGHRLSALHVALSRPPLRRARYLLVDPGPRLALDIEQRTARMLAQGWGAEVEGLVRRVPADAPAWNASGYRTIRDMVEDRISPAVAEQRIVIETRQYAKRQRTWFRHQLAGDDVTHVSIDEPAWQDRVVAWWTNDGVAL